jgi:plastocyanin
MRRPLACLLLLVVGACGSGGDDGDDADVVIVAEDLRFVPDRSTVAAGEITLRLDNRDDGIAHNLHFVNVAGSAATDLVEGPSSQTLTVTIDEVGEHEIICDLHPNMVTLLVVE